MKPTPKLRFVIRYEPTPIRILQQWWEVEYVAKDLHNNVADGEWRDVPLEKE